MKKESIILWLLLALTLGLTACSDDNGDDIDEHANWRPRNEAYFDSIRTTALASIRSAQNAYAHNWTAHTDWRTFLNYACDSTISNGKTDSIYVRILQRGTGSGCPLSTDSVRIFYRGSLIPTLSYPEGQVFGHSGQSSLYNDIFDRRTAVPAMMRPSTAIRGFGTALQHMHIGDRWRIYIPADLGYGATARTNLPAYSTLIFDVELLSYYRRGATIDPWN